MSETVKHPARIFATVNGMSTRLPVGTHQLIGGWSQDQGRPGMAEYVRSDIASEMLEALRRIADPTSMWSEHAEIARAAIAKAEGRS